MADKQMLLAALNLVLGLGIAGVSVCRLNLMESGTPFVKVVPAVLMLTAGLVLASQPWLGNWPNESTVFVTLVVFLYVTVFRPHLQEPPKPPTGFGELEL